MATTFLQPYDKGGKTFVEVEGEEVEVMTKRQAKEFLGAPHVEYIGTLIQKQYVAVIGYALQLEPRVNPITLVRAEDVREYKTRYKAGANDPLMHRRELKMADDRYHEALQALLVIQMGDISRLTDDDRKALVELTAAMQNSRDITARNRAARVQEKEDRRSAREQYQQHVKKEAK